MKKTSLYLLIMMSSLISGYLYAEPSNLGGVSLKSIDVTQTFYIDGRCGQAGVSLSSIIPAGRNHFRITADSKIKVYCHSSRIDLSNKLDDRTTVLCVDTPKGTRLIIGSQCGGNNVSCSQGFDRFTVFNPATCREDVILNLDVSPNPAQSINHYLGGNYAPLDLE